MTVRVLGEHVDSRFASLVEEPENRSWIGRVDTFTRSERSEIMRRVRSTDTSPERAVRSLLHRLGYRFRLHRKDLPGTPDMVLPRHRVVVFVHGCFWHRHPGCARATTPSSNRAYWQRKFQRTVARDRKVRKRLNALGWKVVVVWECQLKDMDRLERRIKREIPLRPSAERRL